jgi:hypothetical protein
VLLKLLLTLPLTQGGAITVGCCTCKQPSPPQQQKRPFDQKAKWVWAFISVTMRANPLQSSNRAEFSRYITLVYAVQHRLRPVLLHAYIVSPASCMMQPCQCPQLSLTLMQYCSVRLRPACPAC